ncbi:hypothetical protein HaLaN_32857 [Haematococcus lacustris]|uniref:Uncharacterized protein n=1 Tax=Haematococcus lacustris TaxID=44745 RepID=A0A6A0ALJ5_HAELA|nr:hypothetical protein HaLaN_32857 [Haematococcus lacustris]
MCTGPHFRPTPVAGTPMHTPARPLRLNSVAESLRCRRIRDASAPFPCTVYSRHASASKPVMTRGARSTRQQVTKALVKAILPDLNPAQVAFVVAVLNKRMTIGSK